MRSAACCRRSFDVAVERAVGIIGRKPRVHLLVRQPLQLSRLATHPSALRRSPDLRSLADGHAPANG